MIRLLMKTTTWLLAPLALATASCLIELSPSAADLRTPAPLVRRDAAAPIVNATNDASIVDSSASSSIDAATTDAAAPIVDASAADATSL